MAASGVKVWVVVAVSVLAAAVTGVSGWAVAAGPAGDLAARVAAEQRRAGDLAKKVEALSAEASAAVAAAAARQASVASGGAAPVTVNESLPAPASKPSITTYAYIRKLTGPLSETFTVYLDRFVILMDDEAVAYAKEHGLTPPASGILVVNESTTTVPYPLADVAKIIAYTGGVEAMSAMPIEAGKLQQWANDHSIIPDATSDMWQVTITKGVITQIRMIGIAG